MHRREFLICYDISDSKRLSKIGKLVERRAFRIQRSVYLFENASKDDLSELISAVMKIFDDKRDDLRVYTIEKSGIHLGSAVDLDNPLLFLGGLYGS